MAVARVQHDQAQTAGASPLAFTLGGAPTNGNLLVIVACGIQSGSPGFDAPPAGFTELYRDPDKCIYWKVSAGTETSVNVTFTTGANDCRGYYVELSGAAEIHTFGLGTWTTQGQVKMGCTTPRFPDCYALVHFTTHSSTSTSAIQATDGYTQLSQASTRNQAFEKLYGAIETVDTTFGFDIQPSGKYVFVAVRPTGYTGPAAPIAFADTNMTRQMGQTKYA